MSSDFFVTKESFPAINPVNFGHIQYDQYVHFGPAVRRYWLIHFVESGMGTFKINGNAYKLRAGEMFVIPPYVETYYESDGKDPWGYTWIGFTCDGELPIKLADTIYCPQALRVFQKIRTCTERMGGKNAYLVSCIWNLFSILLESEQKDVNYVEVALDYIHAGYMHELTVTELARRLSLDRSYFSTLFKEKTGISPKKYLFNYRMNVAADLMINSQQSITTAANSVGYSDISNFSRMFKSHFGLSPRAYIEKHCND